MRFNRAEMKEEVKNDIRQSRPKAILVTLVYLLMIYALSVVLFAVQSGAYGGLTDRLREFSQNVPYLDMMSEEELLRLFSGLAEPMASAAGMGFVLSLVSSVISWTLGFGYQAYCLGMVRGENPGYGRLFCAFPQWGWVLLTGLLRALFTALWTMLFYLLAGVATAAALLLPRILGDGGWPLVVVIAVVALLLVLAGVIFITLRYAMSNYILLDEKTDALEAISRSKAMMRGRKWHLFVLQLSFIGWYMIIVLIVALVSFAFTMVEIGITLGGGPTGVLSAISVIATLLLTIPLQMWLSAYVTGSEAKFYDWLKREDQAGGVWESDYQYKSPYIPQYEPPAPPAPPEPPAQQPPEAPRTPPAPDRPSYE